MQLAVCESTLGKSKTCKFERDGYYLFRVLSLVLADERSAADGAILPKDPVAGVAPASAGEDNLAPLEIAAKGRGLLGRFASPR